MAQCHRCGGMFPQHTAAYQDEDGDCDCCVNVLLADTAANASKDINSPVDVDVGDLAIEF